MNRLIQILSKLEGSKIFCQSLVIIYQLLVTSHQLLITSYQSLVTSYQLLIISYQSLVTSHQLLNASHQLLLTSSQLILVISSQLLTSVIYGLSFSFKMHFLRVSRRKNPKISAWLFSLVLQMIVYQTTGCPLFTHVNSFSNTKEALFLLHITVSILNLFYLINMFELTCFRSSHQMLFYGRDNL